ncbi:hypothetical protein PUNSTDRAFT_51528 [Punctularia strigosozonata HHB-11173 SS5]|uniref:uncharacterized protein n=1 Tax=Punctularia strigosozonata (strain HHB-11173) TaxID=741275 RepID=UPI0004418427|nr:uncharacterized protein PUNSTDRAFT_51528 [Punctularia strigosozonata HHB-11173 SS5]EIN10962.1 hypothetical protein PUNSTDRAFT_51528 [Punctularia strigosozonata HHB-11173 SS5]
MEQHTVKAIEPTALAGQSFYTLRHSDHLTFASVDTVHVVAGKIDIERFCHALGETLQLYPLHAGRMSVPDSADGAWRVRLSNEGVPVVLVESDDKNIVPISTVVQVPLTLIDKVDVNKLYDPTADEPLLRVLITRFSNLGQTSLGVSASHIIGDGYTHLRFMRALSQIYQGLSLLDDLPNFESVLPTDIPPARKYTISPIFELAQRFKRGTLPSEMDPMKTDPPGRVNFRLSGEQMVAIRQTVQEQGRHEDGPDAVVISRQDALIALVASCISEADTESPPVKAVSIVTSCRGVKPFNAPCNGVFWALSDPPSSGESLTMYNFAKRTRLAVLRTRDPEYLSDYYPIFTDRWQEIGAEDQIPNFSPPPGFMTVNSTWKFDWTSPHFGYPQSCRFYHNNLPFLRYVKLFVANPSEDSDGKWRSNRDQVEIDFRLQKPIIDKFFHVLSTKLKEMGISGEVVRASSNN